MIKVGITGGIGSGKTTVCKIFESLGVPVFYTDNVAKELMRNDPNLVEQIKKIFGKDSYSVNNQLNTKHIAHIVFNDHTQLAKLNEMIHPATLLAFDNWIQSLPSDIKYILKESALLFETGVYKRCDKSVVVLASEGLRMQRVMKRDNLSQEQIQARMDKQLSESKKIEMADFVIDNNEQDSIILQVLALHQLFNVGK